jgi:hypothetical protein
MKPAETDLPRGLHEVLGSRGLVYPFNIQDGVTRVPIAASALPLWDNPSDSVQRLPVIANFTVAALDMDRDADRKEYQTIMDYNSGQYGMKIIHLERVLVTKKYRVKGKTGKTTLRKKKVRRIYIEYFAPYRILDT